VGKLGWLVVWIVASIGVFIAGSWFWTEQHEQAHAAVFRTFGHDSEIRMYGPFSGETIPMNSSSNLTYCEGLTRNALQASVDAQQYQQVPLFVGFFVILVSGVLVTYGKREGE
jgi:hypothetical protein